MHVAWPLEYRRSPCSNSMKEISTWQFGLIVAYLLPGFIVLAGIAPLSPAVAAWLVPITQSNIGLAPTVYAVLAALTLGMIVSCFRWLLIDRIHQWTGIRRPVWDDSHLQDRLGAFKYLVEVHYHVYQFYANTIIAAVFAYSVNRVLKTSPLLGIGTDLGVVIICAVLFAGSRDALSNYYAGTTRLVGQVAEKDLGNDMTNGRGHDSVGCACAPRSTPPMKSYDESQAPVKPESSGSPVNAVERVGNKVSEVHCNSSVARGNVPLNAAKTDSR